MKKLVIMPGGFHPFHAGHKALYDAARAAFPTADVYVAATADTSERPFPFELKKQLARIGGIDSHRFIQVRSPFKANEITQMYDPNNTVLIFVRSEKDRMSPPQPGGVKKDGSQAYLQPFKRNGLQPMSKHGYMAYLPTVQFGPGMTSATEIRAKWPTYSPEQKQSLITTLYPDTAQKPKLIPVITHMLDSVLARPTTEALTGTPTGGAIAPATVPMPNGPDKTVDEAMLVNNPERGHVIIPDGGMGSWNEQALVSSLARDVQALLQAIKGRGYENAYKMTYDRWSPMRSRLRALAQYAAFMNSRGKAKLKSGGEYDMSQYSDYLDEAWSEKYKRSINCNNPKGFSQRAHCAGRKKKQSKS